MTRPPIDAERFIAYWANELSDDEVDAIDDHVFGCDACAREHQRIARIVQTFRSSIPPAVSRDEIEGLRRRGFVIRENAFEPGVRTPVRFDRDVDYLIHRLGGLDLTGADRVDVTVRNERGGTLFVDMFAPHDAARGEVLIACQRHFQAFPDPDVAFDVEVHRGDHTSVVTYLIPHVFA